MTLPLPVIDHCLDGFGLVYNRLGEPGIQEDEDFELLLEGKSRPELVDLLMTVAGLAALVLEEIDAIQAALARDGIANDDPEIQAGAILDAMRDMIVNQGVNEPS